MSVKSIFLGSAFRASLLSMLAFMSILLITGFAIHRIVEKNMYDDLKAQILEELVLFREIQIHSGDSGLIEAVSRIHAPEFINHHIVGLFGENRKLLAGSSAIGPNFIGSKQITLQGIKTSETGNFYSQAATVSSSILVIGRSTRQIDNVLNTLARYLLLAGVVMSLSTGFIGYGLSRRVDGKLRRITDILDDVSSGNMSARLPISSTNDQIDQASMRINTHLNQLALLMSNTRNTINAIAHDLRTPLNRVHMLLQDVLQHPDTNPDQLATVEDAIVELDNVNHIFDTVLRISKITASSDQHHFELIEVQEFLLEVADFMIPVVEAAEQDLKLSDALMQPNNAKPRLLIHGDRRMLRQMMVNLIENVMHHCPAGTIILLSARVLADTSICISICDDGPGIPSTEHANITRAFYRLQESRSTPGNGLGLALVAAVVNRHAGILTFADNQPGLCVVLTFSTTI